jgi:hypothetical protein
MSGIYGSSRPSSWLRDARLGVDSVDFLVMGDENAATSGGWTQGFIAGPALSGIPMYASPFYQTCTNFLPVYAATPQSAPAMSQDTVIGVTSFNTASAASGTAPSSGNSAAPSAVKANWNSNPLLSGNGNGLNYGGTFGDGLKFMDFIWQPSGTFWTNFSNGIQLNNASIANCFTSSTVCTFRMLYATSGSGASVTVIARAEAPITTSYGKTLYPLADTAGATAVVEHTRTAGTPPGRTIFSITDYNGSGGTDRLTGPLGVYGYSVYKPATKGVSATVGHQWGVTGFSQLAAGLARDSLLMKTMMKELRQRQIAAGGTGRLCVVLEGGMYTDLPANIEGNVTAAINDIRADWTSQGFPATDISFLVMVGHPPTTGVDIYAANRAGAKTATLTHSDAAFIDLHEIAPHSLTSANGWLAGNPLNLTSDGYNQVGLLITNNLTEYKDPTPYKRLALSKFAQPVHRWDVVVEDSGFATLTINRTILVGRYPSEDCAKAVVTGMIARFGSVLDAINRTNDLPHSVRYL